MEEPAGFMEQERCWSCQSGSSLLEWRDKDFSYLPWCQCSEEKSESHREIIMLLEELLWCFMAPQVADTNFFLLVSAALKHLVLTSMPLLSLPASSQQAIGLQFSSTCSLIYENKLVSELHFLLPVRASIIDCVKNWKFLFKAKPKGGWTVHH